MSQGTGRAWVLSAMFAVGGLAWQGAPAQPAAPVFEVVGEAALPSRQVHALLQDRDARLWIGTASGLVRYDGHGFQRFPAGLERPGALATPSVEALALDARGRLWVATEGGHLARWRVAADDFERIDLGALGREGQFELWSLAAAGERLWAASYGAGLLEIDLDGRVLARHVPPHGEPHLLDVLATADGSLWLLSMEQRWWRFRPGRGFAAVQAPPGTDPLQVYGLAQRGGSPWASTRDGRLCSVGDSLQASCVPLPLLALPGRARMLLATQAGDWVGGLGELLRLDPAGGAQRIAHEPGVRGGVPRHALWVALEDRDGGVWIGSAGGGLLHLPAVAACFRAWQPRLATGEGGEGLRDGRVRGLARDAAGRVWIGTFNSGLHRLDPASGTISAVVLPGSTQSRIWSLLADRDGELWVGHHEGLRQLWVATDGTLVEGRHWAEAQLSGAIVDLLHRDAGGDVWAATMGGGVDRIDAQSGEVEHFAFAPDGLPGSEVQQMGEGPDGRLWVATDRGLHARDAACRCWRALIERARVDAWAQSGDHMYALVDGQLARFRAGAGSLYRDGDWAPRAFAELQAVGGLVAHADSLWLIGPQGLHRYRPTEDRLERFDTRDGLVSTELSDRPPHVDAQGAVWIGGEEGVLRLDPGLATTLPAPAALRFERVELLRSGEALRLPTEEAGVLLADDRELEVAVRLASLARPHAQRFSFRVRAWDEAWTLPAASPARHYGTLPAGSYVLEVRAWDGHGQPAANTLRWPFRVAPPWWRGVPALCGYALALIVLLAAMESRRRRRARAAAQLAESRRAAQFAGQLAGERTRLVAELSHEIRNPLNGVLGMAHLLQGIEMPETGRRHLGLLVGAGRQLLRLLDDMLDWSRLEGRDAPLPVQPLALAAALRDALALHAQQARERGLGFAVAIDDAWRVQADAARLRQIVDNLVGNALKFTLRGGVEVRARGDGERVRIEVQDSGPGMDAAQLERLFRPFERVGDERAAPGTGLGLAISRSLAERMGGRLWAESTPGAGSRFVLELAAAPSAQSPQSPAAAEEPCSLAGLRLLLVDDDAIAREWLVTLLQAQGAQVQAAPEALSALILAQQQSFDAALLDWDLPGMHGLDLACTLRAQFPTLRLIAVTGRATPEDRARGVEAGFVAHVAKPVKPTELCAAIRGACG